MVFLLTWRAIQTFFTFQYFFIKLASADFTDIIIIDFWIFHNLSLIHWSFFERPFDCFLGLNCYRWVNLSASFHFRDQFKLSRESKRVVNTVECVLLFKPGLIDKTKTEIGYYCYFRITQIYPFYLFFSFILLYALETPKESHLVIRVSIVLYSNQDSCFLSLS